MTDSPTPSLLLYMVDADERAAMMSRVENRGIEVHCLDGEAGLSSQLQSCENLAAAFVEVRKGDSEGIALIRALVDAEAKLGVVALTSGRDMEARLAGRAAGADDTLTTPVRNLDLEIRLSHVLRDAELRDELAAASAELLAMREKLAASSSSCDEAEEERLALETRLETEEAARAEAERGKAAAEEALREAEEALREALREAEEARDASGVQQVGGEAEPIPNDEEPAKDSENSSEAENEVHHEQLEAEVAELQRQLLAAKLMAEAAKEEAKASQRSAMTARSDAESAIAQAKDDVLAARQEAQEARDAARRATEELSEREMRTRQLQSQAHTLIEVAEERARNAGAMRRAPSISGDAVGAPVDEDTGLLGDEPFRDHLDREYARSRRYGHALSVLLLDVDRFRRYCKRNGRASGDAALRLIAEVLRGAVRSPDIVARLGGDVFAVLATDTDEDEALQLAQRLRSAFAEEGKHASIPSVTVSIGIASAQRISVARASDLLAAALRAVASAKKAGRDRCSIASRT